MNFQALNTVPVSYNVILGPYSVGVIHYMNRERAYVFHTLPDKTLTYETLCGIVQKLNELNKPEALSASA